MNNYIPHLNKGVITYPCPNLNCYLVSLGHQVWYLNGLEHSMCIPCSFIQVYESANENHILRRFDVYLIKNADSSLRCVYGGCVAAFHQVSYSPKLSPQWPYMEKTYVQSSIYMWQRLQYILLHLTLIAIIIKIQTCASNRSNGMIGTFSIR